MGLWRELWAFKRERKKSWLLPALLVAAQGPALAPFIYTIF